MSKKNTAPKVDDNPVVAEPLKLTDADAAADLDGTPRPDNHLTPEQQAERYGANEEPVVADEFDDVPTVAEARVMFDERPGLAQVLTVEGLLNRDGSFSTPPVAKRLTLDGRFVEVAE